MKSFRIAVAICLGLSGQTVFAENWAEWRGPQHNGISTDTGIATSWAKDKNVAWSVKLPGQGGATPVVWEDRIYLTSSEGDDLVVIGLSTAGKELWKTKVGTGNKDARAGEGNSASPSPVTDGQHVWVFFGTGELACLDREGKIVWHFNVQERYGKIDIQFGLTSTPLLHRGSLYLQLIHGTMHTDYTVGKIVRLVAETGQEVWAVDRQQNPKDECKHAYSSPIIMPGKSPHLITHGGDYAACVKLPAQSDARVLHEQISRQCVCCPVGWGRRAARLRQCARRSAAHRSLGRARGVTHPARHPHPRTPAGA